MSISHIALIVGMNIVHTSRIDTKLLYISSSWTSCLCSSMWRGPLEYISILNGSTLKLVYKFTYLGSSVSSTETDINTRRAKAGTAIDSLSVIWKSDLTDKMKRSFFQAAVVSILLYGYTTWTLIKRIEKRLGGNHKRMLRAILNKSWRPYPTKQQLYGDLTPITKTIKIIRTKKIFLNIVIQFFLFCRCPWCNGYRRRKWTRRKEFKSWTRLIAFHIGLISLGKVWIQLLSLQLWVNSRIDWFLQPWWGN